MSFIEDLRSYLQRIRHAGGTIPEPVALDPSWVRAESIRLLAHWERTGAADHSQKYKTWIQNGDIVVFANRLAELLQDSFLRGASRAEIEEYVRLGITRLLELPSDTPSSKIHDSELIRLKGDAEADAIFGTALDLQTMLNYASEIRAIRRRGSTITLAPIGEVLLSLSGRDALQWLLNVEIAQSTGANDSWRMSRELAQGLIDTPQATMEKYKYRYSLRVLERLGALGLVEFTLWSNDLLRYKLLPLGASTLQSLLAPGGTPFSVLATNLSQDEALAALQSSTSRSLADASLYASAQATTRQARMVAHEIRNALVPAQFALNSLYESLLGSEAEPQLASFRPRIDPGIDRVLKFVNDLLKLSELATRPPEPFEPLPAVQDARVASAAGLEVQVLAPEVMPPVLGYRERFVLALANLLRNAEQAGARHVTVDLKLEESGQSLLLTVDDDGPGVPEEHRESIFQQGFSLRPGGAGEGLALVREVIESEMRGKIVYVDRPGGGARFRMRLPLPDRKVP